MVAFIAEALEGLTSAYYVHEILPYHVALLVIVAMFIMSLGKFER